MPRSAKPARLWLRPAAHDRSAQWVILDAGRQISTGCSEHDYRGAEEALAFHTGKKYNPDRWNGRALDLPIAEAINVYLKEHAPTVANPSFLVTTSEPILKWWGDRRLKDIRKASCTEYAVWRQAQGVSSTTAWHDLKTLRAAINYWHANYGPLPALPVVSMPKPNSSRARFLTRSEVASLLWAARKLHHHHVARIILIGVYTGTRSGAMLDLSWYPSTVGGWVDLDNGILHRRGDLEGETTKRRPSVPIHDRLLPHLRRWRTLDGPHLVPVCHYHGKRIDKLRRSWSAVIVEAGLGHWKNAVIKKGPRKGEPTLSLVTECPVHVLRHTCVTWMLQAGVPIWETAGFVGMSEEMVRKVYGHHCPDFMSNAKRASNKRPGVRT